MAWQSGSRVLLTLALALAGALFVVLAGGGPGAAQIQTGPFNITIDTVNLTMTGEDNDRNAFRGVPFTASVANGVAIFRIKGDLNVGQNDRVRALGPNAVSLIVGNNAIIASGATFDFSAEVGRGRRAAASEAWGPPAAEAVAASCISACPAAKAA